MLIDKSYAQNDTVSVKLSSGEELIGRFESMDESTLILTKPMAIVIGPQGAGLTAFMVTAPQEQKVKLNRNLISAMGTTEPGMASQYMEMTTGLKL